MGWVKDVFGSIGRIFLIFGKNTRAVGSLVIAKVGFKGLIGLIFLSIFLVNGFILSVEQRSPMPFLKEVGTTLISPDQEINDEVERVKSVENPSAWQVFWSGLLISGNIYFIYLWFFVLMWILKMLMNRSEAGLIVFLWMLIFFTFIHVVYRVLTLWAGGLPFESVEWASFIPFRGVIKFVWNIGLWVKPLATFLHRFY